MSGLPGSGDGLRVAQLANFVGPVSGGMRTAVRQLGAHYAAAGAARLLVVPGPVDDAWADEHGDVVQLRAPSVGGGYRLVVEPWRAAEALRRFAPTSLEVSDKSTMTPLAGWARRRGVPALLLSHERLDAMVGLRADLPVDGARQAVLTHAVRRLDRHLARRFDAVVVTSAFAAAEFRDAGVAHGLHRVPLGVDLATFRPAGTGAGGATVGGDDRPLRLVHAGRLSREKSPALAVATALALHRRGVPVVLDVLGDGPQRADLEALAAGAPVRFHGHVDGPAVLAAHLARADAALSVCPGETFGLAVLEALACGTPVVTADRGGARELVDRTCGAWAAPEPEALADAVVRLAARPRTAVRAAARQRAEAFPWATTAASLLDLHRALAGRAGDVLPVGA